MPYWVVAVVWAVMPVPLKGNLLPLRRLLLLLQHVQPLLPALPLCGKLCVAVHLLLRLVVVRVTLVRQYVVEQRLNARLLKVDRVKSAP